MKAAVRYSAYSITALRGKDFGQIVYSPQVEWDGVTVAVDGELRVTGTPSMTPLVRLVKHYHHMCCEAGSYCGAPEP